MCIKNKKLYDALKYCGRYVLPALAVLYGTVGKAWSLPCIEEITVTIGAVALFINTILGISNEQYNATNEEDGK